MEEPQVQFSRWAAWKDRRSLIDSPAGFEWGRTNELGYGCVYLFGRFLESPSPNETASPLAREVVYIGSANQVRNRPMFHEIPKEFAKVFSDAGKNTLFLSIFDVPQWGLFSKLTKEEMAFFLYVERKLIWDYVREHKSLPALNLT